MASVRPLRPAEITRAILVERFPSCFLSKGQLKTPLAIGIHRQVIAAAPDLSKISVRRAIHDYVNGPKYLSMVVPGALRVGIDGSAAGTVTFGEGVYAYWRLEKLHARWKAKRQQKRPCAR